MILSLKTSDLWESQKRGLHIESAFLFCQKDLQGVYGPLKGGHGTKITVQHMVNLRISDL